jgi:hypothetical protein
MGALWFSVFVRGGTQRSHQPAQIKFRPFLFGFSADLGSPKLSQVSLKVLRISTLDHS